MGLKSFFSRSSGNFRAFAGSAAGKVRAAGKAGKTRFHDLQRERALSKLESRLARIVDTVDGHEARGVKRGTDVYVVLADQARRRVQEFSDKYGVPVREIEAQAPALQKVYGMAVQGRGSSPGTRLLLALLGGALALAAIGGAGGVIQIGHDTVIHAAHHMHLAL